MLLEAERSCEAGDQLGFTHGLAIREIPRPGFDTRIGCNNGNTAILTILGLYFYVRDLHFKFQYIAHGHIGDNNHFISNKGVALVNCH